MRIYIFSFSPYFLPVFIFFLYFCPQIVPHKGHEGQNSVPRRQRITSLIKIGTGYD